MVEMPYWATQHFCGRRVEIVGIIAAILPSAGSATAGECARFGNTAARTPIVAAFQPEVDAEARERKPDQDEEREENQG
jgi:hypothetical protein